ncbi:hypothetical protein MALG_04271 (plasmid) [Marinovum algicola DG 898]|nr:hypothetical protein MALG_04271 [Marinovum algicola DG 898]
MTSGHPGNYTTLTDVTRERQHSVGHRDILYRDAGEISDRDLALGGSRCRALSALLDASPIAQLEIRFLHPKGAVDLRGIRVGVIFLTSGVSAASKSRCRATSATRSNGTRTVVSGTGSRLTIGMSL